MTGRASDRAKHAQTCLAVQTFFLSASAVCIFLSCRVRSLWPGRLFFAYLEPDFDLSFDWGEFPTPLAHFPGRPGLIGVAHASAALERGKSFLLPDVLFERCTIFSPFFCMIAIVTQGKY